MSETAAQQHLPVEHFVVEGLHCPSCIREIEGTLHKNPAIRNARVNLTTQRLAVEWANDLVAPRNTAVNRADSVIETLKKLGFRAFPFRDDPALHKADRESKMLLRAMAVSGFAMANVMLLSVSVWSGLVTDMDESTRLLMHWLSALIVLPAAAYAGQPFFRSAWGALKNRSLNMDVPISLAVILACGMSLFETLQGAVHTYYDAAVMLLFFLLIGRYLDRKMRQHARSVAQNLMSYRAHRATVVHESGATETRPVEMLQPGQTVRIMPGERVPVDGVVTRGVSEIDTSLVTGETLPVKAEPETKIFAGTMNLNGALEVNITALSGETLLDEIIRLMETAEQGRAKYVRLADKAARIYAPAVHLLALLTFIGWMAFSSVGWEQSLITAISVLIITCPCALGLAVPVVQVVASSRLFKSGILVKASDGLERMAEIDTVVFDKTGTLTLGQPELANGDALAPADLELAASLAKSSSHPLCRALIVACHERGIPTVATDSPLYEEAGMGLKAVIDGREVRLGNRDWCDVPADRQKNTRYSELWLAAEGREPVFLAFRDRLRRDARTVVRWLAGSGLKIMLLSGDREDVVRDVARELNIEDWRAACKPQDKIAVLESLKARGRKVLMAGDGLNDAPALSAAHVSISPSTAADVSQTASDFVFQSQKLDSVIRALQISRHSRRLVFVNFAFAAVYNVVAVPFAAAGYLEPLYAALAMSGSSIVVIANALRLNLTKLYESPDAAPMREETL